MDSNPPRPPTRPSKASRAYIAGLGTTGILIASSLLTLAIVSAIVAFKGRPRTGLERSARCGGDPNRDAGPGAANPGAGRAEAAPGSRPVAAGCRTSRGFRRLRPWAV
jgi:hypothetical protein